MINLAGNQDADKHIKEELYLADVPTVTVKDVRSEVPYTIIGKLGPWTFKRAWYYWMVSVETDEYGETINEGEGLPLDIASELHEKLHPINSKSKLGNVIRSGGHCGCPHPKEFGAYPIFDDDFRKSCEEIGVDPKQITYGEISKLCEEGKIRLKQFVHTYHIDDQIGLNEFVKVVKETLKENDK